METTLDKGIIERTCTQGFGIFKTSKDVQKMLKK